MNTPTANLCRLLDAFSEFSGRCLAWLSLVMVLLVTVIVVLRTLLGSGSIALQESVTYFHATLLMLCLAYNLQQGGHVRVDVFYSRFSSRGKAWVDALGSVLFLLPFALFLLFISADFVLRAWSIGEASPDPGGLPFVYLLKTLLPLSGLMLALQALSEAVKAITTLSWD